MKPLLRPLPVGSWALGYIERRIAGASDYMKALLNRCGLQQGSAFVYVPHGVARDRVQKLDQGGVIGGVVMPDGSMEISQEPARMLARYLHRKLREHAAAILLAEDLLCLPTDPCVAQINPAIRVTYGGTLYYYARENASLSQIEEVVDGVDVAYPPALLVVAKIPKTQEGEIVASILSLLLCSGEIQTIVTGVFDGESFLVWNRNHKCISIRP
ncbi:MAG: hypothetical protein KatS3mg023_3024 [Armatimonadota bacterium]|nr:MAG: hypothetical protein KatS3mg023_3024 [Armatimonadota bacterium]